MALFVCSFMTIMVMFGILESNPEMNIKGKFEKKINKIYLFYIKIFLFIHLLFSLSIH